MAKAKSPKLHLSLFNSFQICRPKKASSMIKAPNLSHPPYMLSPLNSKPFDISFPGTPIPPPSTPSKIFPLSQLRTGEKSRFFSPDSRDFLEDGTERIPSSRNQTRKHKTKKDESSKSLITSRSTTSKDTDSLFSSPPSGGEKPKPKPRRRFKRCGSKEWREGNEEKEVACMEGEKVEQSFVVVKKSAEPYEDFKRSMSEMIVEKQMYEPRELELLLMSFLSLNSRLHHKVIVEAFTEILKEVFCG